MLFWTRDDDNANGKITRKCPQRRFSQPIRRYMICRNHFHCDKIHKFRVCASYANLAKNQTINWSNTPETILYSESIILSDCLPLSTPKSSCNRSHLSIVSIEMMTMVFLWLLIMRKIINISIKTQFGIIFQIIFYFFDSFRRLQKNII